MNLLIDSTPDFITVGGFIYKCDADFKKWVKYIIATESGDADAVNNALHDIFGDIKIPKRLTGEFINAVFAWMFPESTDNKKTTGQNEKAYDFEVDGNVIYAELWQYFPNLMQRGISWHEGIELIRLLVNNKNTELHHKAFARVGNFSNMSKDERKYWNEERAKLKLPDKRTERQKQDDFDAAMSGLF